MSIRGSVSKLGQAAVVVVVLSLIASSVLGQPILLSYVTSGSMEPTIDTGDGFVAVPTELAGPVEEGDVIVFRAQEVNDGELTTHRVVEETDRGYVTRGDANPFTDQNGGEPPVKDAQVVAKALQVNGEVVVVPRLGVAVTGIQEAITAAQRRIAALLGTRAVLGARGLAYLLFVATLIFYLVDVFRRRDGKERTRTASHSTGTDPRLWSLAFALLVVAAATAAMVVPAGPQEYGIVSAEFESDRPTVIPMGETETVPYHVDNAGVLPVISYLTVGSEGVAVTPDRVQVSPQETQNVTVALTAPPETGYYRRYVVEHRYLMVLPAPVIDVLYRIHPWAPILAIDALFGVAFYLVGIISAGTGLVRNRERTENVSLSTRIRRYARRMYR